VALLMESQSGLTVGAKERSLNGMLNHRWSAIFTSMFAAGCIAACAADWPAYRGPAGDGIVPEASFRAPWPTADLKVRWTVPAPTGFSSFTVADGQAFTLVRRAYEGNDHETCVALSADTGEERWAVKLSLCKYDGGGDSGGGGDGPRSTPVFSRGRVFVLDGQYVLTCLDARSGKQLWRHDLLKDHGGKSFTWQSAASPVVDEERVFVAGGGPGQALLAFRQADGTVAWKGQSERATHATPVLAEIAGMRQVIFFVQSGLLAVSPTDGRVLWRQAFPFRTATAASPVVAGDLVYCSAGYGVGAGLTRVTRSGDTLTATMVWRKPNELLNHWSTPVVKDGYLYGLFGHAQYHKAPLKCVELLTGKEMWSEAGFGPGSVLLAGDRLLILGDKGQLVVAAASPKAYEEISRQQVVDGKCWSTPAISNGRLYARSTTQGVCLEIPTR